MSSKWLIDSARGVDAICAAGSWNRFSIRDSVNCQSREQIEKINGSIMGIFGIFSSGDVSHPIGGTIIDMREEVYSERGIPKIYNPFRSWRDTTSGGMTNCTDILCHPMTVWEVCIILNREADSARGLLDIRWHNRWYVAVREVPKFSSLKADCWVARLYLPIRGSRCQRFF